MSWEKSSSTLLQVAAVPGKAVLLCHGRQLSGAAGKLRPAGGTIKQAGASCRLSVALHHFSAATAAAALGPAVQQPAAQHQPERHERRPQCCALAPSPGCGPAPGGHRLPRAQQPAPQACSPRHARPRVGASALECHARG